MSELPPDHPAPEPDDQPAMDTGRRRALERKGAREPRRIPRTRVRVSTVVLIALFIGLLALYGVTSVRYPEQNNDDTVPVRTTETTSTITTTPTSSSPSSSTTTPSETGESGVSGESGESSESGSSVTLAPGVVIPVPTIPGQRNDTETTQTTSR